MFMCELTSKCKKLKNGIPIQIQIIQIIYFLQTQIYNVNGTN